jgi:DNA-binding CsgD family transcriptional regulator
VSEVITRRGIPGSLPAIDHAQGLLDLAQGGTGRARSSLEAARDGWLGRRRAWEGAWASLDLATAHARSNRPADARRLARDAAERAAALSSPSLSAAAEALDRRLRAGRGSDAAWSPLTARELEVARLIAEGQTNAEIATALRIAPKTVSAHVEHILAKLGATRRAEAAAWVARTAASPPDVGGEEEPARRQSMGNGTRPGAGGGRDD